MTKRREHFQTATVPSHGRIRSLRSSFEDFRCVFLTTYQARVMQTERLSNTPRLSIPAFQFSKSFAFVDFFSLLSIDKRRLSLQMFEYFDSFWILGMLASSRLHFALSTLFWCTEDAWQQQHRPLCRKLWCVIDRQNWEKTRPSLLYTHNVSVVLLGLNPDVKTHYRFTDSSNIQSIHRRCGSCTSRSTCLPIFPRVLSHIV